MSKNLSANFPYYPEIRDELARRKSSGAKLVFTNGCFDLLHIGHIRYLNQARKLGDCLFLGLNSDDSVRQLKGPGRPILPLEERREVLLALEAVDFVVGFNDATPLELIKLVEPDVLVKGGDWAVDKIVGADLVTARGGKVLSLPYVEGRSTSEIVKKIRGA